MAQARARQQAAPEQSQALDEGPEGVSLEAPEAMGAMARQSGFGNAFVSELLSGGLLGAGGLSGAENPAAFDLATSGKPTEFPYRAEMEAKFSTDLGDVQAHVGTPEAQAGLALLGAEAAVQGRTAAFLSPSPAPKTVEHEVVHLVQGKGRDAGGPTQVSAPGQASEKEAVDVASGADEGANIAGDAPAGMVHRSLFGGIVGGIIGAVGGAVGGFLVGGPVGAIVGGVAGLVGGAAAGDALTTKSRSLTPDEVAYARDVFGESVDYGPITLTRDSMISTGAPKTLGNTIHLRSDWGHFEGETLNLTPEGRSCLIHEMGHVWQYQNGGLAYIGDSLWAQLKAALGGGSRNGAYAWEEAHDAGTPWAEWNPEQQAAAIEDYNRVLRAAKAGTASASDYTTLNTLTPYMELVRSGQGAPQFSTPGAVAGGIGGAAFGAGVGFVVGGPLGALVGGGLGAIGGALFGGG